MEITASARDRTEGTEQKEQNSRDKTEGTEQKRRNKGDRTKTRLNEERAPRDRTKGTRERGNRTDETAQTWDGTKGT